MNGRLVLLIVAAAIFVRLWMPTKSAPVRMSAARGHRTVLPRAEQHASTPKLAARIAGAVSTIPSISDGPTINDPCSARAAESTTIEHWTENSAPIALPPDLEPGMYRVIDQTGRVVLLEIAEQGESFGCRTSRGASPEFFVIRNDATTWYFVRLSLGSGVASPASESAETQPQNEIVPNYSSPEPVFGNRKFDFSGYADETEPITPEISAIEPPSTVGETRAETVAAARHTALRLALIQRDAERAVLDLAERLTTWWKRTSIALRHAEAMPITPSL